MWRFILLFITAIVSTGSYAQDGAEKIRELLTAYTELDKLEGAVLVAEGDEVIFSGGFGLANREWGIPNDTLTVFDVGSLTKTFTAVLTLMLVQDNKIGLSRVITDYLPNYRAETGDRVTIHHLLSHTSGIPSFSTREFAVKHGRNEFDKSDFLHTFCSGNLEFVPGSSARYSDSNYFILGRIIEQVMGKSYEQVLEEELFHRLGMRNSGYFNHKKIIPKKAEGYIRGRGSLRKGAFNNRENVDAAGASYSTVSDLFKFDGALYSDLLVKTEFRKVMFTAHASAYFGPNTKMDLGYGWNFKSMRTLGGDSIKIHHGGGNNEGFTAVIYRVESKQYFIAILTNSGPDYFNEEVHEIAEKIVSILYHIPYELPKRSMANELGRINEQFGLDRLIERIEELKKDSTYELNERELNQLGYQLLGKGDNPAAIQVFKLNVDSFPDSFNVYDSMGEAYMVIGDIKNAISNYEKSLELNPNNEHAKQILKQLRN